MWHREVSSSVLAGFNEEKDPGLALINMEVSLPGVDSTSIDQNCPKIIWKLTVIVVQRFIWLIRLNL